MERWQLEGGGTLSLREDGPRVVLEGRRPPDGQGLYKLWLQGGRGGSCLLGTMAPEGGALTIRRTLTRQALEQTGCWPVTGGKAVLVYSFTDSAPQKKMWSWERQPARLLGEEALREAAAQAGPMRYRQEGECFYLAVPFSTDRPLPLTALFCLGRVEQVEGAPHMVWKFNQKGMPLLVYNRRENKTD